MDDFEFSWDFGEVSDLKAQVAELKPEVDRLTNVCNNETRMRMYYVDKLVMNNKLLENNIELRNLYAHKLDIIHSLSIYQIIKWKILLKLGF